MERLRDPLRGKPWSERSRIARLSRGGKRIDDPHDMATAEAVYQYTIETTRRIWRWAFPVGLVAGCLGLLLALVLGYEDAAWLFAGGLPLLVISQVPMRLVWRQLDRTALANGWPRKR